MLRDLDRLIIEKINGLENLGDFNELRLLLDEVYHQGYRDGQKDEKEALNRKCDAIIEEIRELSL
jgi:uncharacterized protein YkvS